MKSKEIESEEDLFLLIFKSNKKIMDACLDKLNELKNDKIRLSVIKIIILTYSRGKLEFGKYLSNYKSAIINYLYQIYINTSKYDEFLKFLCQIEKYGIIMRFLKEVNEYKGINLHDFFNLIIDEDNIKEILFRYCFLKIGKALPDTLNIDNIDVLVKLINDSGCISNDKCDYNLFFKYIEKQNEYSNNSNKKKLDKISSKNIEIKEKIENSNKVQEDTQSVINTSSRNNNFININESESTDILNIKNKDDIISQDDSIKDEANIFKDYYNSRKYYYSKKGYKTPFLDKLISGEIQINKELFLIEKPKKDYVINPYYLNLDNVIKVFSEPEKFQKFVIKEQKFGYFCYDVKKNNNSFFHEGIYAILDNSILYKEITNKEKFEKDDFINSNEEIDNNAFKARGLALEYYINGVFMDLLGQDKLPRVIYNFNSDKLKEEKKKKKKADDKIEEINQEKMEEEEEQEEREREMEELDGVFYVKKDNVIKLEELPFIIDDITEIDLKESPKFQICAEENNKIDIKNNTLIIIEVKNKFPESEDFKKIIYNTFNKAITFSQLYQEKFQNINKIRIMFFYDSVPKKSYDESLLKILNNVFEKTKIKDKIQFQFIFITSSYLAYNFKNLSDKMKVIEKSIEELKKENKALAEDNKTIKLKVDELGTKLDTLYRILEEKNGDVLNLRNFRTIKKRKQKFK